MNTKGISTLISAVILIALVFTIASIVSPWLNTLTRNVANETSTSTLRQIECQSVAYDFDTNFGTGGIDNGITNGTDRLQAKILNTGTVNLYAFSFEIEITPVGRDAAIKHFAVNSTTQKTRAVPLKPGQSAILRMNLSEDLNGTLHEVKILNGVCESVVLKQRI